MRSRRFEAVLRHVHTFAIFFLIVAFVLTCSFLLFFKVMYGKEGLGNADASLGDAAVMTFFNSLLLSAILTAVDSVRRKLTVSEPVQQINLVCEKLAAGDFSARVSLPVKAGSPFEHVAECINKLAQELSGTEALGADFISNVSHELKTPLSVISNYARLLESEDISEDERIKYARELSAAARSLSDLVGNVLRLSKLENQQIAPALEEYDLGEQLCECLLRFESAWEKKQLSVSAGIADGVRVVSDREMMGIVWSNLFSNAIKFTPEGGEISVSLAVSDGFACVSVSDTGCGISQQVGERIFEKFYQGDPSHATEGNGLGLSLVKRVMDLTGNEISVVSSVGKGTSFTVRMAALTE